MGGRGKKRGGKKGACDEGEKAAEGSDVEQGSSVLPMANVVRLMRQVLPPNVKIASSAKQLTHDCAVEFVGFVGSEASDRARSEHRRTIAPEDFTWSFRSLGLDSYVEPMTTYIRGYRGYYSAGRSSGAARPAPVAVTAPLSTDAPPMFTDEEIRFLESVIPAPPAGYNGEASSSTQASPPAAHGNGYTTGHI